MTRSDKFLAATFAVAITLLSACGGGGSGAPGTAPVTPPAVAPTPTPTPAPTYSIGGTITGLGDRTGLALRNGSELLVIDRKASTFTFTQKSTQGSAYNVQIDHSPVGMYCSTTYPSGTVAQEAVQSVYVACSQKPQSASSSPLATNLVTNSLAADAAGNVYATDADNGVIRKITPAGIVSNLADTAGNALRFSNPSSVAVDAAGNVYVLDSNAVSKISPGGVVSRLLEHSNTLLGLAVDGSGTLYMGNNNLVQKLPAGGAPVTLAGSSAEGFVDGAAADARFLRPKVFAVDAAGTVYVTDQIYVSTLRKVTAQGRVNTQASGGSPMFGLAIDSFGTVFHGQVSQSSIRNSQGGFDSYIWSVVNADTPEGFYTNVILDGLQSNYFSAMAVDGRGALYIADRTRKTILKIQP